MPETRYVRVGSDHVAYQVIGEGPVDIVVLPVMTMGVDTMWQHPAPAYFYRRLASLGRLICFDLRGAGSSDRYGVTAPPSLETWTDDLTAVLDVVGADRVVLFAAGEIGAHALLVAATYPERVRSLVLVNAFARFFSHRNYPEGPDAGLREPIVEWVRNTWGTPAFLEPWAPSMVGDREFTEWWTRAQRLAAGPGTCAAILGANIDRDMRGVLPAIRVPTLVAHRVGDPHVRVGHGRYLAEHILGAELLELPGEDHLHFVGPGVDTLLSATERFIREQHPADEDGTHLTTVLFTDIVGSTELAARLGDVEWRRMVDAHDDAVTRRVRAARGRLVQLTGDGVVACFDSPARAVRAAIGFREDAAALGLVIRAGVHTGGVQQRLHNLAGITVHVAARVQDAAAPGEILVSRTCVDLVAGGDLTFSPRGEHALKGVPEPVQLYAVDLPSLAVPRQPPAPADATAS